MALRPTGERWAVTNGEAGIAALVTRLQAIDPQLMVLEATGGYQQAVVAALAAAGRPIVVVNPRQARDVAKATGQLAKTDGLDARALAHLPTPYGLRHAPCPTHKRRHGVPCWRGVGNSSPCGRPNRTASVGRLSAYGSISKPI